MTCGMGIHDLTPRERQAIDLRAEGFTYAQVATRMNIRPETVKNYIGSVYEKLDVHSTVGALRELGRIRP